MLSMSTGSHPSIRPLPRSTLFSIEPELAFDGRALGPRRQIAADHTHAANPRDLPDRLAVPSKSLQRHPIDGLIVVGGHQGRRDPIRQVLRRRHFLVAANQIDSSRPRSARHSRRGKSAPRCRAAFRRTPRLPARRRASGSVPYAARRGAAASGFAPEWPESTSTRRPAGRCESRWRPHPGGRCTVRRWPRPVPERVAQDVQSRPA